ncbi:MAG: alpha/beta hydrolase [Actinomycetia bacterium]|nr:alpha/beta hydrolase [Actinomycetes bacterium]MCP4960575.1 alpha/beta hydrolase [Actinomycetes bacterium]
MRTANGDYEIEYETFGRPTDPALLLVNGLGSQMIAYRDELCDGFVSAGFFVIRYDNRDVGLSSKTSAAPPSIGSVREAIVNQTPAPTAYSIHDMAADGMAVLDALEVDSTHVWGMSMGGMIVQTMGYTHADRVLSITSVMSTTGAPGVGQSTPEALAALMEPAPSDRDEYVEDDLRRRLVYASTDFDIGEARTYVEAQYDRCFHPDGVAHQYMAVLADGDRTQRLASITAPTSVIHGGVDTLIDVSGGVATVEAIAGAELVVYENMGHDLPRSLWESYIDEMRRLAQRAR